MDMDRIEKDFEEISQHYEDGRENEVRDGSIALLREEPPIKTEISSSVIRAVNEAKMNIKII